MAAKRGNAVRKEDSDQTGRGKAKVQWRGYVNLTLNQSDKERIKEIENWQQWTDQMAESAIREGYTLKERYDSYNQCVVSQLYCEVESSPNAGWCLSMRGDDWFTARFRVLFTHYVILSGVWPVGLEVRGYDGDW